MTTVKAAISRPVPQASSSTPALEASGLCKRFAALVAVDRLTLRIGAGEIFCLLGPNGAGKTTTINMFLGFVVPSEGAVRVCGVDVTRDATASKRHLAYIPEQVMLYRNLAGVENLEYFSALAGVRTDRAGFERCLIDAGVPADAVDRRVSAYSKGMRQKVGIAIALAKNAQALLLDEPTSGLDPKAANEFSVLLRRLADSGVAVLMATHDLFRAKEAGTRVGIMRHGRMVAEYSTEQLGHTQPSANSHSQT